AEIVILLSPSASRLNIIPTTREIVAWYHLPARARPAPASAAGSFYPYWLSPAGSVDRSRYVSPAQNARYVPVRPLWHSDLPRPAPFPPDAYGCTSSPGRTGRFP